MDSKFYHNLTEAALAGDPIERIVAEQVLSDPDIDTMDLLHSAYIVRKTFRNNIVTIHIINNGQNGHCPEDCQYCAQAKTSDSAIHEYPLKSDDEFLTEAKAAFEKGAHRYCMVFAGRGPSRSRVERLAALIRKIKENYPLEVCVSAGLLDSEKAAVLREAGLDRLNHNLNTSERHYQSICSTHTYADRRETLRAAREAGLQLCSGVIVGMEEAPQDLIEVAYELREFAVESIPVNFLMPIPGNRLTEPKGLTPQYALRVLCLYRFVNPRSEIRMAAGREMHLRSLQVMGLYAADSLFLDGYLNTRGDERRRTLEMIRDAGFAIRSEIPLEQILAAPSEKTAPGGTNPQQTTILKDADDLRPCMEKNSQIQPKIR